VASRRHRGGAVPQGNYKNIILDTCDDSCPKDELLTNKELSAEELLTELMKTPTVYTKVERYSRNIPRSPTCIL
jgi:hypothetical protein